MAQGLTLFLLTFGRGKIYGSLRQKGRGNDKAARKFPIKSTKKSGTEPWRDGCVGRSNLNTRRE
jgi:hypothetical protein